LGVPNALESLRSVVVAAPIVIVVVVPILVVAAPIVVVVPIVIVIVVARRSRWRGGAVRALRAELGRGGVRFGAAEGDPARHRVSLIIAEAAAGRHRAGGYFTTDFAASALRLGEGLERGEPVAARVAAGANGIVDQG
jgi:hypothetical protein